MLPSPKPMPYILDYFCGNSWTRALIPVLATIGKIMLQWQTKPKISMSSNKKGLLLTHTTMLPQQLGSHTPGARLSERHGVEHCTPDPRGEKSYGRRLNGLLSKWLHTSVHNLLAGTSDKTRRRKEKRKRSVSVSCTWKPRTENIWWSALIAITSLTTVEVPTAPCLYPFPCNLSIIFFFFLSYIEDFKSRK